VIRTLRIWLWGIVAELEYQLYPWKSNDVPQWAIDRYNIDNGAHSTEHDYEGHLNFEWLKSQEEKVAKLQLEMLSVIDRLNKMER
jgi:hypothetical protein